MYIFRKLSETLSHHIQRKKSILLLGPRQVGKTTLLKNFPAVLSLSLITPQTRQRYEREPGLLQKEIQELVKNSDSLPLVIIDEIQKIPTLLDVIQEIIDQKQAQFILTGSSARKLRRGRDLNLLPGRLVSLRLDPFLHSECPHLDLENILIYGTLPDISLQKENSDREIDLASYVESYLEEEVRAEALVRNIGQFSRFLEYAGLESGGIINFNALSQEIGVSHTTIASYFEILEDCLIAEKIDPITQSQTRKKLTKSSRYLIFDLGVRRLCARQSSQISLNQWGGLFEQYVGLELIRHARFSSRTARLRFWRDPGGPEVDWVLEKEGEFIPIEVKWTENPETKHIQSLKTFLREYPQSQKAYVVCRTPRRLALADQITAIPWQELAALF